MNLDQLAQAELLRTLMLERYGPLARLEHERHPTPQQVARRALLLRETR